jgi:hypothetical protein
VNVLIHAVARQALGHHCTAPRMLIGSSFYGKENIMKIKITSYLFITAMLLTSTTAQSADPPSAGLDLHIPQLKALDHYAGVWDIKMAIKSNDPAAQTQQFKGVSRAKWILNGRFLQQTGTLEAKGNSPQLILTTLWTYDTQAKTYRSWTFTSAGSSSESTAVWVLNPKQWPQRANQIPTEIPEPLRLTSQKRVSNPGRLISKTAKANVRF